MNKQADALQRGRVARSPIADGLVASPFAISGALRARGAKGYPRAPTRAAHQRAHRHRAHDERTILATIRSGAFDELIRRSGRTTRRTCGESSIAGEWGRLSRGRSAARHRCQGGRAVFDAHRLLAYLELGEPARAIPECSRRPSAISRRLHRPAASPDVLRAERYDEALDAASARSRRLTGRASCAFTKLKANIAAAKKTRGQRRQDARRRASFAGTVSLREATRSFASSSPTAGAKLGGRPAHALSER